MRYLALAMCLLLVVAGCGGTEPNPTAAPIVPNADTILATRTAIPATALPTNPPPAPILGDPNDPLTIVLGGEYGNGGYWTWEDIANLLGYYAQYDVYSTTTLEDREYTGVPLSYLLDYAELSEYSLSTVIFDRRDNEYSLPTNQIRNCETCLLVQAEDGSITLVLPHSTPKVVEQLVRIESR